MQIIDYFRDNRQEHWMGQIAGYEWRAARFLAQLLQEHRFHETLGRGTLYLLTEGDVLVSFLTLAERDCIDDASLRPWIGFVHTAPAYRGHRYVEVLIEHAMCIAGEHGAGQVYICTDHVGLYERYGFSYLMNRISVYGEDSRVYVRKTVCPAVRVERLSKVNFCLDSLDGFIRYQEVRRCWRQAAEGWRLEPIAFTENWDSARLREEAAELMRMNDDERPVFIALAGERVIGFASLGERFGSGRQYIDLCSLHVSEPWRGRGVGRKLFEASCAAARALGAQKLYISAHSSEESQAAYRALGCTWAQEIDPAHVDAEPFDVQMEYVLVSDDQREV